MGHRSRYWCFTENVYPELIPFALEVEGFPNGIGYLCGQLEKGEHEHFQGYVELEAHQKVSWLKKNLSPTAHFEIRRGTQEEAIAYCCKQDKTFVLGTNTPIALLSTGPPVYFGTGQRRAFKVNVRFKRPVVVRFNATNGGSIADIVDNSFHVIAGKSTSSRTVNLAYSSRIVYLDR